jgi:hypothetical protein
MLGTGREDGDPLPEGYILETSRQEVASPHIHPHTIDALADGMLNILPDLLGKCRSDVSFASLDGSTPTPGPSSRPGPRL